MTTQHIIYPTRYAGTTLVTFADNFERAHEIFMNVMDVAVVCVDIPRSELCANCAQASAFFDRSAAENEAHEASARRMEEAADLIEAQAAEIARFREVAKCSLTALSVVQKGDMCPNLAKDVDMAITGLREMLSGKDGGR